jgi:hypothetical protein
MGMLLHDGTDNAPDDIVIVRNHHAYASVSEGSCCAFIVTRLEVHIATGSMYAEKEALWLS